MSCMLMCLYLSIFAHICSLSLYISIYKRGANSRPRAVPNAPPPELPGQKMFPRAL